MPPDDTPAPAPPSEFPLLGAVLMLGARQLADIWLSVFCLLQGFALSLILVLATLRTAWQVPLLVYQAVAIAALLACLLGLAGGIILWRKAEHQARAHVG